VYSACRCAAPNAPRWSRSKAARGSAPEGLACTAEPRGEDILSISDPCRHGPIVGLTDSTVELRLRWVFVAQVILSDGGVFDPGGFGGQDNNHRSLSHTGFQAGNDSARVGLVVPRGPTYWSDLEGRPMRLSEAVAAPGFPGHEWLPALAADRSPWAFTRDSSWAIRHHSSGQYVEFIESILADPRPDASVVSLSTSDCPARSIGALRTRSRGGQVLVPTGRAHLDGCSED